ncbi:MAG: serine/threonine-protein kinase [bacterium]
MFKKIDSAEARPSESAESYSVLDRSNSVSRSAFSENQALVDQLVSNVMNESTKGSTLAAMVGAGWAFRLTRAGLMSAVTLSEGSALLPTLVRGGSYVAAFGVESATFAGIERGFHTLEGRPVSHSFTKDWARAAVNLGSIKFFGAFAGSENLVVQHAFTDLGMVGGQNVAHAWGLTEKPEGNLAQQLVQAEVTNWTLKAGMSLVGGMSPGLMSSERSLDLYLRSKEMGFPWQAKDFVFASSRFKPAVEGGPIAMAMEGRDLEGRPAISDGVYMANQNGGGNGSRDSEEPTQIRRYDPKDLKKAQDPEPDHPSEYDLPKVIVAPDLTPPQPDTARPSSLIGKVIDGRYLVESQLGVGGMGVVYRCRHQKLGTLVAMKVLRDEVLDNSNVTDRFLAEAQAATSIGNPHIIKVLDFGTLPDRQLDNGRTVKGASYFIMEFLEGFALSAVVNDNNPVPVKLPRLVKIATQMAEGLSAAHHANIVHRDLKTDNVYLSVQDGKMDFVKILDFGIAKINANDPARRGMTAANQVFGTVHYMAPEQALGESVDARADIYAYGVILYEMATGKIPFDDRSEDANQKIMLMQISKTPVPPRELNPNLPEGLEAIILKCMAKNRNDRYQSMDEILVELQKLSVGEAPVAEVEMKQRKVEEAKRKNWPIYGTIGGGIAVLGVFTAILALTRSGQPTANPDALPGSGSALPVPSITPIQVTPGPSNPPKQKEITVSVNPIDADIYVDGEKIGNNTVKIPLTDGQKARVEVRRKGYVAKPLILDGKEEKIFVNLDPEAPSIPSGKRRPPPGPSGSPKPPSTVPPSNPPKPWGDNVDNPWKPKQ